MKHLNQNYIAAPVINALEIAPDEFVGATVKHKNPKYPADHGLFVVGGKQKMYGFDANGKYTIIEGYRVFATGDQFGRPLAAYDMELVSSNS